MIVLGLMQIDLDFWHYQCGAGTQKTPDYKNINKQLKLKGIMSYDDGR